MSRFTLQRPIRTGVAREQIVWEARGSGPGLVLLNGYGASGLAWPGGWTRRLQERFTVVTVDLRGGGRARFARTPFTIGDLAADVAAVLDDANLPRAIVLGLSMGGMVAQELAIAAPGRVAGLVLVGTRPPVPAFTPPPLMSNLRLLGGVRGSSIRGHYADLWSAATAPGFAETHVELIDELVEQTLAAPTPRAMLLHQMRAMSAWGHAERLQRITAPTVVVHGTADEFSPLVNGRAIAKRIPDAQLRVLEGVGHLVPLEAPEALDAVLDELAVLTR